MRIIEPESLFFTEGRDEVQYDEWFGLVTDQTHIEEERTIFPTDWQEAQMRIQVPVGVRATGDGLAVLKQEFCGLLTTSARPSKDRESDANELLMRQKWDV